MAGCGPVTLSSPTLSSPLDAGISPAAILSRVDLPQPDGPMIERWNLIKRVYCGTEDFADILDGEDVHVSSPR